MPKAATKKTTYTKPEVVKTEPIVVNLEDLEPPEPNLTVVRFRAPIQMAGSMTVCGPKEAKRWQWKLAEFAGTHWVNLFNERIGRSIYVHLDMVESFE